MEEYNYLDLLIDLILDNSKIDYLDKDLMIDDDKAVMGVIKVIANHKYNERLKELKGKKDEEKKNS